MEALFTGITETQVWMWTLAVAMARLIPAFRMVPFLGGRHLAPVARYAIILSIALFLTPWLRTTTPAEPLSFARGTALIAKEVLVGTVFGFVSSLLFLVAAGIGFLVDNQRGMSMADEVDPLTGEQSSPLGNSVEQTLYLIFVAVGGLALFFQALLATYAFWPPFSFWPDWSDKGLSILLTGQLEWYMATIVILTAPMLLVCFLVDFGMGLMNRFAPQLNVYFLAMPVKSGVSMLVLVFYWGALFAALKQETFGLPVWWEKLRLVMI